MGTSPATLSLAFLRGRAGRFRGGLHLEFLEEAVEEVLAPLGGLGADAEPVADAVGFQRNALVEIPHLRIGSAKLCNAAPVVGLALIHGADPVNSPVPASLDAQTNHNRCVAPSRIRRSVRTGICSVRVAGHQELTILRRDLKTAR